LENSFEAHSFDINIIKQSPFKANANYVATCSNGFTVKIWNVLSSFNWTLIRTYSHYSAWVLACEWLDKDTLASSARDEQTIKIWSVSTGQTKLTINVTSKHASSLTVLNTKIHLVAGLSNSDINIYNINDGSFVSSLNGHIRDVNDLVQMSDDLLASASDDETVRIWNLTTNTCKFILKGHTNWVRSLKKITPSILASGSLDSTIKLWDITSGQEIRTLTNNTGLISKSFDLIDSQKLVSGSRIDETINLWNWSTGECLSTIQTYSSIDSLAVININ